MCDATTFLQMETSRLGGEAMALDAKSKASLEAVQLEAMMTLASARSMSEKGSLRRAFAERAEANAASAAVSGASLASFASVQKGNDAERDRASGIMDRNAQSERGGLSLRAKAARMQGSFEAKAARFSANMQMFQAAVDGLERFGENSTGDYADYAFKSMGIDKKRIATFFKG